LFWVDVELFRNAEELDRVQIVDEVHLVFVFLENVAHFEVISIKLLPLLGNFLIFLPPLLFVTETILFIVVTV
jgi:hypothetical protein